MSANQSRRWVSKVYGKTTNLEIETFETPNPGKDEVLVKVFATTATYTDLLIINGNYHPKFPVPVTPGYDLVGKVHSVGAAVSTLKVGDIVVSMPQNGGMSTDIVLKESQCVKIEACSDPSKVVSVVLTGITAYQMLHRVAGHRINDKATLLVHGAAGGTGAMIIQLAKMAGVPASNIYGTCSAKNLEAVRALGVHAVCYEAAPAAGAAGGADAPAVVATPAAPAPAVPAWDAAVREGTGGRGVDVVFDSVVMEGYLSRGLGCLAAGGIYIAYGFTNTGSPGMIDIPKVLLSFLRLGLQQWVWSWFDGRSAEFYNVATRRDQRPADFAADARALAALVEERPGRLDVVIGKVWPFEGARDALAAIEANSHRGKQVVLVDPPPAAAAQ